MVPEGDSKGVNYISVNEPPRDNYKSREKYKKIPYITCAKKTK